MNESRLRAIRSAKLLAQLAEIVKTRPLTAAERGKMVNYKANVRAAFGRSAA